MAMTPALSVWLDLCRVLAALAVYLGHSVAIGVAPGAMSTTWHRSADDAVTAFFVISGLVIAHTTRQLNDKAGPYALARLSRVYSVAIPAVLLALAVDLLGMRFDPGQYSPEWQYPKVWLFLPFHWLFLGETWFGAIQPFSMAPYWSLGYEVWYYLLFGCVVFMRGRARWVAVVLVLAIMGPRIVLLLPIWWLGVLLYRHMDRLRPGVWVAHLLMVVAVLAYLAFFLTGLRDLTDAASNGLYARFSELLPRPFDPGSTVHVLSDYVMAVLFVMFVVGCAHSEWRWPRGAETVIRRLAGYTFSFYLIHFTLLVFARAVGVHNPGWGGYALLLLAVLAVTWMLGQVGEQRRRWYRDAMVRAWGWLPRK
jgi:peptidoglycan/LPS O-acetylase OafA/YrhL